MKTYQLKTLAACAALSVSAAQAAGPLYLWEGGDEIRPYTWNTANGAIPVYTDGGEAFTFDFDGVTPFITIERANEITQFGFDEWNNVSTSTFEAQVQGTIESVTGIADVTVDNAGQIYYTENGYGFFVTYDSHGDILSDYFGVGSGVLGIAYPEWADETTGEITEATAILNGWAVWENDPNGDQFAGVFTHEFGHAINLSHSQVNGDVFYANSFQNRHSGPANCGPFPAPSDLEQIETMFPFLSVYEIGPGAAQSTVNLTDDRVAISNLYPTPEFASDLGSITGVLRLKDGQTEYSGINIVARNLNAWYDDAVSAMSGDQTQGLVGPDGRFTINGLTPGEQYILYIESIWAGGYPTTPQPMVSQGEYWNEAESNDPVLDDICEYTPITAEAGVTQNADITFNGYLDGIQYTRVVDAYLTDISKNGKASAGQIDTVAFKWDQNHGFAVLPPEIKSGNATMNRNGSRMTVQYDFDGDGIAQATLAEFKGQSGKVNLISLGDLNGDSCGGSGVTGTSSSYAWEVDDAGHTVVGTAYIDADNDGSCQSSSKGEIVPFIWTQRHGMRQLPVEGVTLTSNWTRAQAVSGNGQVVVGSNGGGRAVAWIDEGPLVDLYSRPIQGRNAFAINQDGSRVAMQTYNAGSVIWNPFDDSYTEMGALRWCEDVVAYDFLLGNLCEPNFVCPEGCTHEFLEPFLGPISVLPLDMNDAGTVITGRAGDVFSGFSGFLWVEGIGWLSLADFFQRQGVIEALDVPMDSPTSIDGSGDKMVGGLAGAQVSWHVDMSQVFVCKNGHTISTHFPEGMVQHVENGAEIGRCAFID